MVTDGTYLIHLVRIFAIFYKTDKIASMLMRFVSQIS